MKNAKMKSILLSISLLLILSLSSGTVYAYDSVVTGNNNPELDVKAVQESVDKGGTVLLKGTFNFGQKGQVNIKNDIEVSGESDDKGNPMTKIMGKRDAKAIRPKPSTRGLRPLMDEASPTPRAVTRGTVIVDVVTPPVS